MYAEYEELIEIRTLGTYAGYLPKAQRIKVIEWASTKQEYLMQNFIRESTVMKKKPVVPRIIRILKVHGFVVRCMFNNGEVREVSFDKLFDEWKIREDDVEYPLLQLNEFAKVELRNFTLSWPNIVVSLIGEDGSETHHPYEVSPEVLYSKSEPVPSQEGEHYGKLIKTARIKAGLTQEQLAQRSGTSRFYISRLENNRTDVELSTIRKIVEAGLGKHLKLTIE